MMLEYELQVATSRLTKHPISIHLPAALPAGPVHNYKHENTPLIHCSVVLLHPLKHVRVQQHARPV